MEQNKILKTNYRKLQKIYTSHKMNTKIFIEKSIIRTFAGGQN